MWITRIFIFHIHQKLHYKTAEKQGCLRCFSSRAQLPAPLGYSCNQLGAQTLKTGFSRQQLNLPLRLSQGEGKDWILKRKILWKGSIHPGCMNQSLPLLSTQNGLWYTFSCLNSKVHLCVTCSNFAPANLPHRDDLNLDTMSNESVRVLHPHPEV